MIEKNTPQDEIDALIDGEETEEDMSVSDFIPDAIVMTSGAYEKSSLIGPLVREYTKHPFEWSAFMAAEKDDANYIVRDIILQKGQEVHRGNVVITGTDIALANSRLEEKNKHDGTHLYVIGWIHGHGLAPLVPSRTDETNFMTVANSVSLNTESTVFSPFNLIEGAVRRKIEKNRITYAGTLQGDGKLEHVLPDASVLEKIVKNYGLSLDTVEEIDLKKIARDIVDATITRVHQPTVLGFSYYVIMNNQNDTPYGSIGTISEKMFTKEKRTYQLFEKILVKKIEVKDDIPVVPDVLKREIRENIPYTPPKRIKIIRKWIPSYLASQYPQPPSSTGSMTTLYPVTAPQYAPIPQSSQGTPYINPSLPENVKAPAELTLASFMSSHLSNFSSPSFLEYIAYLAAQPERATPENRAHIQGFLEGILLANRIILDPDRNMPNFRIGRKQSAESYINQSFPFVSSASSSSEIQTQDDASPSEQEENVQDESEEGVPYD